MDDKKLGKIFTVSEVAEQTGLSAEVIRVLIRSSVIQAHKKSGRWFVRENDLRPILEILDDWPSFLATDNGQNRPKRLVDYFVNKIPLQFISSVIASGIVTAAYHYLTNSTKDNPQRVVVQHFYALADRNLSLFEETLHPKFRNTADHGITFSSRNNELKIFQNMFSDSTSIIIENLYILKIEDIGLFRGRPCLKIITKVNISLQTKTYGEFKTSNTSMIFFIAKHEGTWRIMELHNPS